MVNPETCGSGNGEDVCHTYCGNLNGNLNGKTSFHDGNGNGRLSHTVGMGNNGSEKNGGTGRVCICGNRFYDGLFPSRSRPVPSTSGIPVPLLPVESPEKKILNRKTLSIFPKSCGGEIFVGKNFGQIFVENISP